MAWPTIAEPSSIDEQVVKEQVRSKFETGRVLMRSKFPTERYILSLRWEAMTTTDYALLKAAFIADQGSIFTWDHPLMGVLNVMYSEDKIEASLNRNGFYPVTVALETV